MIGKLKNTIQDSILITTIKSGVKKETGKNPEKMYILFSKENTNEVQFRIIFDDGTKREEKKDIQDSVYFEKIKNLMNDVEEQKELYVIDFLNKKIS